MSTEEEWENSLAKFFPCCPLCGDDGIAIDIAFGRRFDYVSCLNCKAKWEVDWKGEDFLVDYVKLIEIDSDKEGRTHINKELSPNFWRKMASHKQKNKPRDTVVLKEREVVREVVVKVRCPYCGNLFDEIKDRCPHCGGKR